MASKKHLFICIGLIIIVLALYWQVRDYVFVNYDDDYYVTENYHVIGGLTLPNIIWAFKTFYFHIWHPLTWLSHMLDYQLFGLNPGMHHLINVFFHVVNTLLLFLVIRRMTQDLWQSAFIAALFAVHPLHIESVAWITERKDVLSTFFWFLTMWAYVGYVETPKISKYFIVLICFILGLLSKPMVVTLPFVLLLVDYWPLQRFKFSRIVIQRLVIEKLPMLVFSAATCLLTYLAKLTYLAQEGSNAIQLPLGFRIENALISYIIYLFKMIWPVKLAVYYPYPLDFIWWHVAGASLLLLLLSLFFIRFSKKHPYLIIGWLWYLGTLVPVIGLIQNASHARADRYTYIPLVGIFIIIAWGIPELLNRWRYKKMGLTVIAVIVLTAFSAITLSYIKFWRNSVTLFEHAVAVTSSNVISQNNLGLALLKQNQLGEAIEHFKKALYFGPDAGIYYNMGIVSAKQNKIEEAISYYRKAVHLRPDYAEAYNNLGAALTQKGNIKEAIDYFRKALQIRPDYIVAKKNLNNFLMIQKRTQ